MSSVNAAAHAIASKEVKAQGRGKRPQWQAGQPIRKAEESNTDKPPWGERGRGRGRAEPEGVGGGGGRTMYRGSIRVADRTTGRRRLCLAGRHHCETKPARTPGGQFPFQKPRQSLLKPVTHCPPSVSQKKAGSGIQSLAQCRPVDQTVDKYRSVWVHAGGVGEKFRGNSKPGSASAWETNREGLGGPKVSTWGGAYENHRHSNHRQCPLVPQKTQPETHNPLDCSTPKSYSDKGCRPMVNFCA